MTTIHSTAGCQATLRVLTALEILGTPAELTLHPDGWFESTYGRSGPVLEDAGLRLFEINAILRHLARAAPGLWPGDRARAAAADAWMDFAIGTIRPTLRRLGAGEPARDALDAALAILDAGLADRTWLAGELTVADLALLHLAQLTRFGVSFERTPHLRAWLERLTALPAVARATERAADAATRRERAHPTLEALVQACRDAAEPAAVAEVLRDAVARRDQLLAAIGPCGEQATRTLYRSPALTVQWISWAPGMRAPAHDHHMWAVIGVLRGREDNGVFQRAGERLERTATLSIGEGEVATLPADVIHDVANPFDGFSLALHVYGGDILGVERSSWHPMTGAEQPFNGAMVDAFTAEFNARQRAEPVPFAAANVPRVMAAIMTRMGSQNPR